MGYFLYQIVTNGVLLEAPGPVVVRMRRDVHTAIAIQSQPVLHWDYAEIGYRGDGCADECPVDAVAVCRHVGFDRLFLFWGGAVFPPSRRGVVIVRAGVDDGIGFVSVR